MAAMNIANNIARVEGKQKMNSPNGISEQASPMMPPI
jgi:hypothetical protein